MRRGNLEKTIIAFKTFYDVSRGPVSRERQTKCRRATWSEAVAKVFHFLDVFHRVGKLPLLKSVMCFVCR